MYCCSHDLEVGNGHETWLYANCCLYSMGLLSPKQVPLMGSPTHSLAEHLLKMLSYKAGERDMVILHDIIDIEWPNNTKASLVSLKCG